MNSSTSHKMLLIDLTNKKIIMKLIEIENSPFVDNIKEFNFYDKDFDISKKIEFTDFENGIFSKCNTIIICNFNEKFEKLKIKDNNFYNMLYNNTNNNNTNEIYYLNLVNRNEINLLINYCKEKKINIDTIYTTLKYNINELILNELKLFRNYIKYEQKKLNTF